MAELRRPAHDGLSFADLQPGANIAKAYGDGRFAGFRAAMEDPNQVRFYQCMVAPGDKSPQKRKKFLRPRVLSISIATVSLVLFGAVDRFTDIDLPRLSAENAQEGLPPDRQETSAPRPTSSDLAQTTAALIALNPPAGAGANAGIEQPAPRPAAAIAIATMPPPSADPLAELKTPRGIEMAASVDASRADLPGSASAASAKLDVVAVARGERPDARRTAAPQADGARPAGPVAAPIAIEKLSEAGPLMQIATLHNEGSIAGAVSDFDRQFKGLGQDLNYYVNRMEIGGDVLHVVYVGPFESAPAAASMCGEIRRRGGDCVVPAPVPASMAARSADLSAGR